MPGTPTHIASLRGSTSTSVTGIRSARSGRRGARTSLRCLSFGLAVASRVVPMLLVVAGPSAQAHSPPDDTGASSSAAPLGDVAPPSDPLSTSRTAERAGEAPAAPASPTFAPPPRASLDLTLDSFAIGNGAGGTMPLTGLELDLHLLSTSWFRAGLSAGAGRGHGAVYGREASARYGTLGLAAAVQLPTRFSPFIAGRLSGGLLVGSLDSALAIPGTSAAIGVSSGATWIYTQGIDLGAQLYAIGSLHLTGSVGWVRATWRGPDVAAIEAAPAAGLKLKDVESDSVVLKVGLGS